MNAPGYYGPILAPTKPYFMKKNILIFGLIMGAVLSANMVYTVNLCYQSGNFSGNDIVGYASMIVIFSFIFIAVRNYRNKFNGGLISFSSAFKMGALIAFIAATCYVVTWLFYYYLFVPDFLDKYIPYVLNNASAGGATPAEVAKKTADMDGFKEMYKNPLFVVLITYSEVFPVGLIVALISALILKKKAQNQDLVVH